MLKTIGLVGLGLVAVGVAVYVGSDLCQSTKQTKEELKTSPYVDPSETYRDVIDECDRMYKRIREHDDTICVTDQDWIMCEHICNQFMFMSDEHLKAMLVSESLNPNPDRMSEIICWTTGAILKDRIQRRQQQQQ